MATSLPTTQPAPSWIRPRTRRFVVIGLLVALPCSLYGGYRLFDWLRDRSLMAEAESAADAADPGWRLSELEARRAAVPDEENGALCVLAASELMHRPIPNDIAWNSLEDTPTWRHLSEAQKGMLRDLVRADAAALAEAQKLADLPRGRFTVEWKGSALTEHPPHLWRARDVTWLLHCGSWLRAAEGDFQGALVDCRAAWNAGRSFGDEPFLPSQASRLSCRADALFMLERILGQGQPPPEALRGLIGPLLDEDREPLELIAWRGERAAYYEMIEASRAGQIHDVTSLDMTRPDARVRTLDTMNRMVEIAKLPEGEQISRLQELWATLPAPDKKRPDLGVTTARSEFNTMVSFRLKWQRQQARLRCAVTALAAERYRAMHDGHWPQMLADLTPDPLPEILIDPFDGQPLRYRHDDESPSIIIYSVGTDGKDDGGRVDDPNVFLRTDIGIRVWDLGRRNRFPEVPD
jgi:hypothetical protein